MPNKGLIVEVYRRLHHPDISEGGLTSGHNVIVITGDGVPEEAAPSEDRPELILKVEQGLEFAEPPTEPKPDHTWKFGGTFVYRSGSQFPNPYPIPVHDRQVPDATISMNF